MIWSWICLLVCGLLSTLISQRSKSYHCLSCLPLVSNSSNLNLFERFFFFFPSTLIFFIDLFIAGTPTDAGILPRTLNLIFNTVGRQQYPGKDLKTRYFNSVVRLDDKDIQKEEERKEYIFKLGSELNSAISQSTLVTCLVLCPESLP